MATITTEPLVIQELTEFYRGPLRQALQDSSIFYAYGEAATCADFDDMVFDQRSHSALVEMIGHADLESGQVIAHGRGAAIAREALAVFTELFGAPVTFVVEVADGPEPYVQRGNNGPAKIARPRV